MTELGRLERRPERLDNGLEFGRLERRLERLDDGLEFGRLILKYTCLGLLYKIDSEMRRFVQAMRSSRNRRN